MEYEDFRKDFIERTLNIIQTYQGKNEVTLLINCLTGLLILPKEKSYSQIPDQDIKELQPNWGITRDHIKQVRCERCGYKLRNVVRQMRNSVAHMGIEALSKNGEITEVKFKGSDCIVEIPVGCLKKFVITLATSVV